jgi:O-antigen/teichoic acid export membrane protein
MRPTTSVRRNLAAGVLGDGWAVLIQIAFVPVYVKLLGIEGYGLIGAVAILFALFAVLDSALAPAISRVVARALAGARPIREARTLLRSVEILLLAVAIVTATFGFVTAEWLVERWLRIEALDVSSVAAALRLFAFQVAIRLFVAIYRAVLVGAQELVWLSAFAAGFATLRGAGVVPILWAWPGIEAFFAFQALVTVLEAGFLGRKAWSLLSDPGRAWFSLAALGEIRRFSVGVAVMTILWQALHHSDKALLSAMLPLADVGRYALASSAAAGLALIVGPFASVAFPRLTELAARGDNAALSAEFHQLAQMVVLTLAPVAWVVALFAEPLLFAWTRDGVLSSGASPFLAVLAIAGLLKGCMTLPYTLQLATGRSRAIAGSYAAMLVVFVPSTYFGSMAHGAIAAAYAWVGVTVLALAMALPLLSASLSVAQASRWLGWDVAVPIAAAGLGAGLVRSMVEPEASGYAMAAGIVGALLASLAFTALGLPGLRARRLSIEGLT